MDSLAGQMKFGSDAVISEECDEDIGIRSCTVDISCDGDHLINCEESVTFHLTQKEISYIIKRGIP